MILGLAAAAGPGDAQAGKVLAQVREGLLVEEAGQIVRGKGNQFALRHPDEKGIVFVLGLIDGDPPGRFGKGGECLTERRFVATKLGSQIECLARRRRVEKTTQQGMALGAGRVLFVEIVSWRLVHCLSLRPDSHQ